MPSETHGPHFSEKGPFLPKIHTKWPPKQLLEKEISKFLPHAMGRGGPTSVHLTHYSNNIFFKIDNISTIYT